MSSDDSIKALRQDPDFRALVNALESQSSEQVESFYSHYECSEHEEKEGTEHVRQYREKV